MTDPLEGYYDTPPEAEILRLQQRFRFLGVLYLLLVLGVLGYAYGRRNGHFQNRRPLQTIAAPGAAVRRTLPAEIVATVNGEDITRAEAIEAMDAEGGAAVVRRLVRERVILQEAAKEKVTLDDPDSLAQLDRLAQQVRDPEHYRVSLQTLKAQLMLRKMVLKGIPESTLLQIYSEFKDELAQYEVFKIRTTNAVQAQQVEAALHQGASFEKVAARYSLDRSLRTSGGRIGFMGLGAIGDRFGPAGIDAVYQHVEGSDAPSPPIPAEYGLVILKIGQVRSEYHDLVPVIADLVTRADGNAWFYRQLGSAKISFPVHDANVAAQPPPETQPDGVPDLKSVFAEPSAIPYNHKSPGLLDLPPDRKTPDPRSTGPLNLPDPMRASSSP